MALRLVAVSTFPIFPPLHGGQRRIADVMGGLAANGADVTIVALGSLGTGTLVERLGPRLRQITVERSESQFRASLETTRGAANVPCEDIIADETPRLTPRFVDVLRDACRLADVVIAAHPYCISSIDAVWAGPVVYHAENDEAALKASILPPTPLGSTLADAVREIEERCVRRAALVFAISNGVADALSERYGIARDAMEVAPPSIESSRFIAPDMAARTARRRAVSGAPVALFVGSGHPPNFHGAQTVVVPAARALPEIHFVVAGSVCDQLVHLEMPRNVTLMGVLPEEELRKLLALADVALNPIAFGGGVNIKMLDYVAGAAPILTSRAGLAGLEDLASCVEVVDEQDWAPAIRRTLALPAEQLEARTAEAQRLISAMHAPAVVAGLHLARIRKVVDGAPSGSLRVGTRKKIVVATHHTIHPVNSGGARRMQQLFGQLATRYDIIVNSRFEMPQPADEVVLAPGVLERRTPRSPVQHEFFLKGINRFGPGGRDEVCFDETAWLNPHYAETLARSLCDASLAFCTHPYAFGMLRRAWRGPIVYDSMDVEYISQLAVLKDAPNRSEMLQRVAAIERRCAREADLISTISETDADLLVDLYDVDPAKLVVVPPALDSQNFRYLDHAERAQLRATSSLAGRRIALFIGSNWPMNIHATVQLADIARALPDVLFLVVGSVAGPAQAALGNSRPENVQFTGVVDDETFRNVLAIADVAVNPIVDGSGTCMKVLDYIAAGLPLVTSPLGGRGYGFADDVDADVVPIEGFPARVRAVLDDPERAQRRAAGAYARLSRERSWEALVAPLFDRLESLIAEPVLA